MICYKTPLASRLTLRTWDESLRAPQEIEVHHNNSKICALPQNNNITQAITTKTRHKNSTSTCYSESFVAAQSWPSRLAADSCEFRQVESQDLAWQPGHDTIGLAPTTDSDEPLSTSFRPRKGQHEGGISIDIRYDLSWIEVFW